MSSMTSGCYPDFVAVARYPGGAERHYLLAVKAANKCEATAPSSVRQDGQNSEGL